MRTAVVDKAVVSIRSDHRQEHVVVEIAAAVEIEVRWKNADDGPARAVEIDRAANHCWMGIETPPPKSIAHHQHTRSAWLVFIFAKEPSDLWLHPQRCKEARCHIPAENSFRFAD